MKTRTVLCCLLALAGCGGGGGGGGGGGAGAAPGAAPGVNAGSSGTAAPVTRASFTNFETIPTRALALSPNGQTLFVTNTPDSRLEIFDVGAQGVTPRGSVQVGLDPVAVAARTNTEVWVVNHLSDSVSVVDVSGAVPRVVRTLLVGDEPRDVVFAGTNRSRAFISAAARGQNHPNNIAQELLTPGLGRADVWVFDATSPGNGVGGTPLSILRLFGDKPGPLTVSPDGSRVFVGIFTSGNESTVISQESVCGTLQNDAPCMRPGGLMPGGVPGPNVNQVDGTRGPLIGTIVKLERATGAWRDVLGRDWRNAVRFTLPDLDVFEIDATTTPPRQVRSFAHVGTLNVGMTAHPTNGNVYVANTEAINLNRFLSLPGSSLFPNPNGTPRTADPATGRTLNGHLYESRVTVLGPTGTVLPRHLNKHIDYEIVPSPAGVKERSVGSPHSVTFSPSGQTLYVAAMGSNQIVRFTTSQINDDSFVPTASTHIPLSGVGPTNMVIDPATNRGFVYTRFDNALITLNLDTNTEIARSVLFNPEPLNVTVGRRFFFDSTIGSSNGEASCAVCHPNADKDDLAWDLGTPFFGVSPDPNPFEINVPVANRTFSPLKGPMTVLTMRGIGGSLFWRGDRTNTANPRDTLTNFNTVSAVFPALMGRDGFLPDADFNRMGVWALTLTPPPNPIRNLDNSLTTNQQTGSDLFFGPITDTVRTCAGCHTTNLALGQFGTDGDSVDDSQLQNFKIPHLRNQYDKVGMFGRTDGIAGSVQLGPQVRGTGTRHNGSNAGGVEFLTRSAFTVNATQRAQLTDFMHAFPSNVPPIVGQQVTLRGDSDASVRTRVTLMMSRAGAAFAMPGRTDARECELIAKGVIGGVARGFLFQPATNNFRLDDAQSAPMSVAAVLDLPRTPGQELTFTCVYPGGGSRIGLDRDEDAVLDFNDR